MLEEKERAALYTLMKIPGMYPARLNAMYAFTESFREALSVSEQDWIRQGVFKKVPEPGRFEEYRNDRGFLKRAESAYRNLASSGVRMIDFTEEDMPARLRTLSDPPKVLFVKGGLPRQDRPSAAVIGSRNCSEYGRMAAAFFGRELSAAGVQIVSGMAAGCDTASLEGGLNGGTGCFAVLGSGVNVCYPRSSRTVYNRILREDGGILSEYCPDEPGIGYHFVIRNRLIAALGDVLLVIEAREKSGTAITVENALEQGKDIFALPGRITDPLGCGCNRLIRDGAMILTGPQDVLYSLGLSGKAAKRNPEDLSGLIRDPVQKKILSLLGPDPVHLEEVACRAALPIPETVSVLSVLETAGAVRSTGNAYFVKVYR